MPPQFLQVFFLLGQKTSKCPRSSRRGFCFCQQTSKCPRSSRRVFYVLQKKTNLLLVQEEDLLLVQEEDLLLVQEEDLLRENIVFYISETILFRGLTFLSPHRPRTEISAQEFYHPAPNCVPRLFVFNAFTCIQIWRLICPRCSQDASKMLPDASKMLPRCFPDACQRLNICFL